jgi:adenylate cyclase
MERIWQWAWDRYGARYSWAIYAVSVSELLSVYLALSCLIVAFERSDRYVEAAAVTVGTVLVMVYVTNLPGLGGIGLVERWAAGREVDRARALDATYAWSRTVGARAVGANAVFIALLFVVVGGIAGATGSRLVQYAILGAASGISVVLIAVHSYPEGALRPARVALAGATGMGDTLPRSRPTFAAWSNLTVLAAAFAFALGAQCWRPCSNLLPVKSQCSSS